MGWDWGSIGDVLTSPDVRDVAAVALVCGVVYVMRHAGSTMVGVANRFGDRLEGFKRGARP